MTGTLDRIEAKIKLAAQFEPSAALMQPQLLALVEVAKAAQDEQAAVKAVLSTLAYYIGPNARTAVSQESIAKYRAVSNGNAALAAALARLEDNQ